MLLTALSHLNQLRPIIPTAVLLGVSPTVALVHTSWRFISLLLPKRMYYPVEDFIWAWYQKLVIFVFESWSQVELVIEGDIPKKVENVIAICNHQSSMDWIVMDFLANRQGMVGHMRYVFKNVLKYFPLYGYIWGEHGGIFVKRDGTYNAKKMKGTLSKLIERKVPLYLVIYPEGTRYNPEKKSLLAKSQAYAFQNQLEPLTHVLTPRIKAFHCALSSLDEYTDAVYDVTIIYEGEEKEKRRFAPTMWDVLAGKCKRIFIQFDRIPIKNVPYLDGVETPTFRWLHSRFRVKDALLSKYYRDENDKIMTSDLRDWGRVSDTGNTLLATTSLFAATVLLLSTPTGRMVYTATVFGGSVLGMAYAHMFF